MRTGIAPSELMRDSHVLAAIVDVLNDEAKEREKAARRARARSR